MLDAARPTRAVRLHGVSRVGAMNATPDRAWGVNTMVGDGKIIGSTQWRGEDGRRQERHQLLTIRGGKIVDTQGLRNHREADRFARRAK